MRARSATCAPHLGQQPREVVALSATGQLGMAPGKIQLTVVSLAERAGHTESATLSWTPGGPAVQLHLAKRPPAGSSPSP
jgi:hypothetical protein